MSDFKWGDTYGVVDGYKGERQGYASGYTEQLEEIEKKRTVGEQLTAPAAGREYWPEVLRAISATLPGEPGGQQDLPINERNEVRINFIGFAKEADLSTWYADLPDYSKQVMAAMAAAEAKAAGTAGTVADPNAAAGDPAAAADPAAADPAAAGADPAAAGPSGEGYVVTLTGVHYHDLGAERTGDRKDGYLRRTVLQNLRAWTLDTPVGEVPIAQLGISHPALVEMTTQKREYDPEGRTVVGQTPAGRRGGARGGFGGGMNFGGGDSGGYVPSDPGFGSSFDPDEGDDGGGYVPSGPGFGPTGSDGLGGPGVRQGPAPPRIEIGDLTDSEKEKVLDEINEFPFVIQFVWKKTPPELRKQNPGDPDPVAAETTPVQ